MRALSSFIITSFRCPLNFLLNHILPPRMQAPGSGGSLPSAPRSVAEQRYAPRPACRLPPGGSARQPPGKRTNRTKVACVKAFRQPTQVRIGSLPIRQAARCGTLRVCESTLRRRLRLRAPRAPRPLRPRRPLRLPPPHCRRRSRSRALGEIAFTRFIGFAFACDIQSPARQPRREADILSVASDRKRQLIVGNNDQ